MNVGRKEQETSMYFYEVSLKHLLSQTYIVLCCLAINKKTQRDSE